MENKELLLLATTVAKEKDLPKEDILSFISDGIETALRKNFPEGANIQVDINPTTGEMTGWRLYELVQQVINPEAEMLFNEIEDEIQSDGYAWEKFEFSLTRQQLNIVKQVTLQKIKQQSKEYQIKNLLNKSIKIYTGIIKIIKKDSVIIDLAGLDIIMPKSHSLPKDNLSPGKKITFTLVEEGTKEQVIASRASEQFLEELMKQEISQIEDGEIEIVACSRNPGMRSKVIVKSKKSNLNALKTCIGNKGIHIKNIVEDLNGEFIDIIEYETEPAKLLINSISPIGVNNIIVDEDNKKMEISVDSTQISQAIGKGGKNIEMISNLLGWKIEIYTIEDWEIKQNNLAECLVEHFKKGLNCDDDLAEFLVESGINSIEEIAYLSPNELNLDLDDETVSSLKENAKETVANKSLAKETNAYLELAELNLNKGEIETLVKEKIYNISDIAELSIYDLEDIIPEFDIERGKNIIMKARHQTEEKENAI